MGTIRMEATGTQEVMRMLGSVEGAEQAVKAGLRRGAEILADGIRAEVQQQGLVRTGKMRDAVKVQPGKREIGAISAAAGIANGDAPHAHLVDGGHGGPRAAPAHPFMEPAARNAADAAEAAVMAAILEAIGQ